MKRNSIVKLLFAVAAIAITLLACKGKSTPEAHEYTCPMHPDVVRSEPGPCPICGMDLVPRESNHELHADSNMGSLLKPAHAHVISGVQAIKAEQGKRIVNEYAEGVVAYDERRQLSVSSRVSGRIEKLFVRYNYQPVRKGQVIMEIYSPDLVSAQRELLLIAGGDPEAILLAKARRRLSLLGMSTADIEQVIQTGRVVYSVPVYSSTDGYVVEKNDSASSPVLLREGQYVRAGQPIFSIYQSGGLVAEFSFTPTLASRIRRGQQLSFYLSQDSQTVFTGTIGLVEPVLRDGGNFTRARVYLHDSRIRAGQLVVARVPVVYEQGWWLPRAAVLRLGNRAVVFREENGAYIPAAVRAGAAADGMVQVNTDIGGWQIAANASYLVDDESFIKTNQ